MEGNVSNGNERKREKVDRGWEYEISKMAGEKLKEEEVKLIKSFFFTDV
jgi:hypothetical protein